MTPAGTNSENTDDVPWSEEITGYDEKHFIIYLRLLDASAEGASFEEMASLVLGIDPIDEPQRAQKAVSSHLRRAHWMTEKGYMQMLRR